MENTNITKIEYIKGNIFDFLPNYQNTTILCHICNDLGIMGGGIALTIKNKFPKAFQHYSDWYKNYCKLNNNKFLPLGITQFIPINQTLYIANMIAQHDIDYINDIPPIRYQALENCLDQVANYSLINNAQVIGPKFGAGLAGGDWNIIETIIQNKLCNQNIQVTIFEL